MTDSNDVDTHKKPDLKVVPLNVQHAGTTDDIDVDIILDAAKGKLESAMLIGFTNEGKFYLAMSLGSIAENLLLVESARLMLNEFMIGD